MKDFLGKELRPSDEVYVASIGDKAKPVIERGHITEIQTLKKNGEPLKEPKVFIRPVTAPINEKGVGMLERNVKLRVGRIDYPCVLEELKDRENIPGYVLESLEAYASERRPQGHFLEAVISNDLYAAVNRADTISLRALKSIVYLREKLLPPESYGSKEKYKEWISGSSS